MGSIPTEPTVTRFQIASEGAGYRLSFAGVVHLDDVIGGFDGLRAEGLDAATPWVILDFAEVASLELDVEEQHRVLVHVRVLFNKGREFRVALVAPPGPVRARLVSTIRVRDLLTGRDVKDLPEITYVDSVDEAREWIASPGADPENMD
ncbi:MAG: hypothetical protein R8F63_08580 [Acidimicrobiales bacterium]|nr:hypothetical protein [Acidimicrobiales bacterium]